MTAKEINDEIAENIAKVEDLRRKVQSWFTSLISYQKKYDGDKNKSASDLQYINTLKVQIDNGNLTIVDLLKRNETLNNNLVTLAEDESKAKKDKAERDLIESKAKADSEKKLAEKGLTPEMLLEEQKGKAKAEAELAKAKADVESIKAKAEADVLKQKADYEIAKQQQADNEIALKKAKEEAPKGMNPILKISLIALGVAGVMIGGFLLVKKMKK
jgi:uncharacterized membrane protein YqiK